MVRTNLKKMMGATALVLLSTSCAMGQGSGQSATESGAAQGQPSQGMSQSTTSSGMQPQTEKGKIFESAAISFEEGKATLSDQDKSKLRDLAQSLKQNLPEGAKISRAKLAVWSDQEHPQKGNLSKADRQLANQRSKNIQDFLKSDVGVSRVTTFNMTENRHWVGRMFHREEAELDAAFSQKGEKPVTQKEFSAIKDEGGPSKAVVILEHDQKGGK